MTVTKNRKIYKFPESSENSDNEGLQIPSIPPSEISSADEAEPSAIRPPLRVQNKTEVKLILKKRAGKRKVRRFQNVSSLVTLKEEDEEDLPVMEDYKSPFAKLLDNPSAISYWHDFINKSEEEQEEIIKSVYDNKEITSDKTNKRDKNPYFRISSKIRCIIKMRKNLSLRLIEEYENDLILFFINTPKQVYLINPPKYFDRLLLHAISQYHLLDSTNVNNNNGIKIKVLNNLENWEPVEYRLTKYLDQQMNKF